VAPGSRIIRLALFGQPVAQSLSPRIHGLFARQLALRVDYRAIEATPQSLPRQLGELARSGARGCNVTVPCKHAAWSLATRRSGPASLAQAANTLVFEDETDIFADNTDGQGLVNDLLGQTGNALHGARICVLGAGGAAAGILAALLSARPTCVFIANRTAERALQLATRHVDLGRIETCVPADIGQHGPFDLIINATSHGHRGGAPSLSATWFAPGGLCYDLNYGEAAAPLRRVCDEANIRYSDGLGMLVGQAALSFALWTGRLPDTTSVLKQLRS